MSTYLYLQCEEHDPPIVSDSEVGQHLYDLPQIREDLRNRDLIARATEIDFWPDEGYSHFRRATARFLQSHRTCYITIQDEYNRQHPLTDDEE